MTHCRQPGICGLQSRPVVLAKPMHIQLIVVLAPYRGAVGPSVDVHCMRQRVVAAPSLQHLQHTSHKHHDHSMHQCLLVDEFTGPAPYGDAGASVDIHCTRQRVFAASSLHLQHTMPHDCNTCQHLLADKLSGLGPDGGAVGPSVNVYCV